MIKLMLITNSPALAEYAESNGVSRIFIDLEMNGKKERQGHLDTLISHHVMEDVKKVRKKISRAELLVRLNPLYDGSKKEIDDAIFAGADLLMLPMFKSAQELEMFSFLVGGRVGIVPLVETYSAAESITEIVKVPGISEIYIGLNDLHLDMGLKFMFEPLANGYIDSLVKVIRKEGLAFGFGGIARVGEGIIPGEMILAEHIRLGSESVILSRSFHGKSRNLAELKKSIDLRGELEKLEYSYCELKKRTRVQSIIDHKNLTSLVRDFVSGR